MSKSFYLGTIAFVLTLVLASSDGSAVPVPFDFVINPTGSGLNATLGLTANTAGTLIGNYNVATAPFGTATAPAGFLEPGPGPAENLPVPLTAEISASGPVQSRVSGSFRLAIDPGAGQVTLTNYLSNLLDSGAVNLPLNLMMLTGNFKTANPNSFFPAAPMMLPSGDATLTALSAIGTGGSDIGTLTPIAPDRYSFSVTATVVLSGNFEALGMAFALPPIPAALPLEGEIVVSGTTAVLTSMRMVQASSVTPAGAALPTVPLDMPTVNPSGGTAHFLLNLTLNQVGAGAQGDQTLVADGILVPEPGSLAVLLAGLGMLGIRRRAKR